MTPVVLSLPIADRRRSLRFYRDGLGWTVVGPLAEDGVPEPLRLVVGDGLHLMLIPTGGFDGVIGDHTVAQRGTVERLLSIGATTAAEVDHRLARAVEAGATVAVPAAQRPWGYTGVIADPDGHLVELIAETLPDGGSGSAMG